MNRFLLFTLPDVYILKGVLHYIYQLPTQPRLLDYSHKGSPRRMLPTPQGGRQTLRSSNSDLPAL